MKTELYTIGSISDDTGAYRRAAALLKKGELVAFPTETVYGLGASALSQSAAEKIYAAKGRPSDNPLIVHVAFPELAEEIAYTSPLYYRLATRFMPGPLTVILPKRAVVPSGVTGGLDTVAIRCPAHPVAHQLLLVSKLPIAAPSANRSGAPSPTTAQHVLHDMDGRIPMILDGGACAIGLESTVVTLTENGCRILRPGAVTAEMLREVCETVTVDRAVIEPSLAGDQPLSPGMKYKHYAPKAEVVLLDGQGAAFEAYIRAHLCDGEAIVVSRKDALRFAGIPCLISGETQNAEEASRSLFAVLREADARGYTKIYMPLPPQDGAYLALYNRLIRASGGKITHIE